MGTTSRLIEVLPGQMREIALRIKRLREGMGCTQEDLAERCNRAAEEIYGREDRPRVARMSRSRIAHLEQAGLPRPGKGAAMTLQPHEVGVLGHALGISPEQLVGDRSEGIITWDPLTDPRRARHFLGLVDEHLSSARGLFGWAEFLPCSLETREFMHRHHQAIFAAEAAHLPEELRDDYLRAVVTMYDTIGDRRREALLATAEARAWEMTHLILKSDLEEIARGGGPYASIDRDTRHGCLANLARLIGDRSLRITLIVADDAVGLRHLFRGFDSLVVFDDAFAFWRYESGDIAYTRHPSIVRLRRALLETCRAHAIHSECSDVGQFLEDLLSSM